MAKMTDLSSAIGPTSENQADRLSWGVIELQVTDLERSALFWTSVLGLIERSQTETTRVLGTNAKALFVLHSGASRAVVASHTGMYHVAIGVRSQVEFSRLLARLLHLKIRVGPTDHLLAKSLYLTDPDGLEIEITFETPERFGHFGDTTEDLTMYDSKGRQHSGRGPLDVAAELSHVLNADIMAPIAEDTYLAHLHFKVASLEPALNWFESIGFSRHLTLANWGFADMGAGEINTHRLAMNTWAGENHPFAPDDMARLIRYELIAHDTDVVASSPLQRHKDFLRGRDPTGVELVIRTSTVY